MRDVLVHATRFKEWTGAIEYAADLTARLDGSLTGTYVFPSPMAIMPPFGPPDLLAAVSENARVVEETARLSGASFVAWAKGAGAREAAWQVAEGRVPETLAHLGSWNDVLVLERNPDEFWGSPAGLGSIVLSAGIPCIIVPPEVPVARLGCMALAWNGTAESIRAIHAAIPLIRHAARVVLLRGVERDTFDEIDWIPRFDIGIYLARHDIAAESHDIVAAGDRAGHALLEAAGKVGADLLVMGAYGRTRFSEWMFGGATRSVLEAARMAVFMRK